MSSGPAFDQLLQRLAEADAEFVLVGGLAVGAWGVVRATDDVDVVVSLRAENLKRLAQVAVAAGGHARQGDALLNAPAAIASALAGSRETVIETDLGRLHVFRGFDGMPGYEELRARASAAEVLGATVPVVSLDDLRAMKRGAGRARDLADLEDLEIARGRA